MKMTSEEERAKRKARQAVITKYARLFKSGQPMLCNPTAAERAAGDGDPGWGSNGKIIYDTVLLADLAMAELIALGASPMRVYECERSKHGHVHLTGKMRDRRYQM